MNEISSRIALHVGFGDYRVSSDPRSILTAIGLGSCVAVTLYDAEKKIGGMIHVVLPTGNGKETLLKGKYADHGIPGLVEAMEEAGARHGHLTAKIAGGAKILKKNYPMSTIDVGEKNVQKCLEMLARLKIPVEAQDTGGSAGRAAEFHVGTGTLIIRQRGERAL